MDIRPSTAASAVRSSDIVVQPTRPAGSGSDATDAGTSAPLEPAVQVDIGDGGRRAEADTTKRQFSRDPETDTLVYKVMDPVSGELFLQLPDEATLRARIYARELEARASAETAANAATVAIA